MAIPSFVDFAVTSASIKVANNSTLGSNSFLSGSTAINVSQDPSFIAQPDAGSVILAQASSMVHRAGYSFKSEGAIFRGGSTSIRVTDAYYDDQVVTIFVNTNAPATSEYRGFVGVDVDKRVYWS